MPNTSGTPPWLTVVLEVVILTAAAGITLWCGGVMVQRKPSPRTRWDDRRPALNSEPAIALELGGQVTAWAAMYGSFDAEDMIEADATVNGMIAVVPRVRVARSSEAGDSVLLNAWEPGAHVWDSRRVGEARTPPRR